MLFLLNDQIAEIETPEIHLTKCWKSLGCGDPYGMRAREALDFASRVVAEHTRNNIQLETTLVRDLASLIIAKTGANAALFPMFGDVAGDARLTILPETILQTIAERQAEEGRKPDIAEIWPIVA